MIGISFDTPADNQAFQAKHDFPFPLLSDPEKLVGAQYEAVRPPEVRYAGYALRLSYLIDPAGVIVKSYEVTDPSGHGAEVLADLEAAQR